MEKTLALLDSEEAIMLPERQTLSVTIVEAVNSSTAVNALTVLSAAISSANQGVFVITL